MHHFHEPETIAIMHPSDAAAAAAAAAASGMTHHHDCRSGGVTHHHDCRSGGMTHHHDCRSGAGGDSPSRDEQVRAFLNLPPELRSDHLRHHMGGSRRNKRLPYITIPVFLASVTVDTLVVVFFANPALYSAERVNFQNIVFLMLIAELMVNFYKLCTVRSVYKPLYEDIAEETKASKADWTYCLVCGIERPPRATHCFDCEKCILKRDHHCFFFNNCIGHYNCRYFIVFIMYLLFITSLVVIELYDLLTYNYKGEVEQMTSVSPFWICVVPLWSVGFLAYGLFTPFLIVSLLQWTSIGLFVSVFYSGWMLNLLIEGQTTFEATNDIRKYDNGWKSNIRQVFGTVIPVVYFIYPFDISLPSNGIYWQSKLNSGHSVRRL